MRREGVAALFALAFGLAMVAGVIYTIHLVGAEVMATLLMVLAGALGTALVLAALALPIRAWRKNDNAVIERHYHDGTRTIVKEIRDGRVVEPKLYQLPAPPQNAGAFPELLRAAYQAGMLQQQGPIEAGYREVEPVELDEWEGEIRP
ncbi:MAG TPA: hypothetical protein G4O02_06720 [Caldilineae bacterium]|jgi:type IV secretory pathway VirB3-like protein|nr:hypothetical protein [Caldilineae bacterium]